MTELITLAELKVRLKIAPSDTSQDDYLQVTMEDTLDFVKQHCRSTFELGLPGAVKRAVVLLVKAVDESNVSSQSLGDMSKSFFKGATYEQAMKLLEPFVGYDTGGSNKVTFIVASSKR